MKKIIAVILSESARIPIIGCAMLNNTALVESICYIDDNFPSVIQEISPTEFTTIVSNAIEEEKEVDFVGFAIDTSTNKSNSVKVKALRSYRGITLFKRSYTICLLAKEEHYYYFWYNEKYYVVERKLSNFLNDNNVESAILDKPLFKLNEEIYNIFISPSLEKEIYNTIISLHNLYNYTIEESIDFLLEVFNYNSKSLGVKMHKNKVKQLLGLDAKGNVSKKLVENIDILEENRNIDLEEYIDGVTNMEELKSSFKPKKKNVKEILSETHDKVTEELEIENTPDISIIEQELNGESNKIDDLQEAKEKYQEIVTVLNEHTEYDGDPNCSKCRGKGYLLEPVLDLKIKCDCVDRYKELKSSKEGTVHGIMKVKGTALLTECMELGLIPRRRINDLLGFREMGDRIGALCKENGESINLYDYEIYKTAIKNVLSCFVVDKELDYSILFSAPNGFGKTTFVYSCLKLLVLNGKKVVPFVSLFELAQKRLDYMTDTTWRKGDDYYTDTERKMMANASYNGRIQYNKKLKSEQVEEEEIVEPKKFIDMTDTEKDIYIQGIKEKNYTYKDYLDSDVLFCQLSVAEQSYIEISTLKSIMDYRGLHCKPTIIITDRNIEAYKSSVGMATDVYLLTDMLTKEEKFATYDRALLVAVKKDRKSKFRARAGENV